MFSGVTPKTLVFVFRFFDNHFYLLEKCQTKYFMWLADDDLLSPACLENLLNLLEGNNEAVTAIPNWELVNENYKKYNL